LEYYDDERALMQSLSLLSSEEDKNYRATKFKQITDISLDAIAGVIAVAIRALIAYCVVFIPGKDISQLWNIFAVIIGYYFGKNISRNSASTASR
jgi:hypothetical protein